MRIVLQALIMTGERFSFNIYPTWLIIFDSTTVQDFYGGNRNFFTDGYLEHWMTPILSW